jgi:hypothetical protein
MRQSHAAEPADLADTPSVPSPWPPFSTPFTDTAHRGDAEQGRLLLTQAANFVHEQKQLIRRRQGAMHRAREEWHKSADVLRWVRPSTQRDQLVHMLKQVQLQ